jgi:putative SOS response-associated peptidase YedK
VKGKIVMEKQLGLIPHWAADPFIGNRMINARAETLTELPSFKNIVVNSAKYDGPECIQHVFEDEMPRGQLSLL